jgi:hypothetical protein
MQVRTDAITNEVLVPITFVLAYPIYSFQDQSPKRRDRNTFYFKQAANGTPLVCHSSNSNKNKRVFFEIQNDVS